MFKRIVSTAPVQAMLSRLAGIYMDFAVRTTRWDIEGREQLSRLASGAPCIVVFWHECLPACLPMVVRERRRHGCPKPGVVLASRHRDGRLIGNVARYFGLGLVLGSTSRGGAAGLRNLLAALRGGVDIGITPDGPRGPRRVAAPGVARLAALAGAPVLPMAAWTRFAITLRSWDRMRIPVPFGRGRFVCGEMLAVPREGWMAALPRVEAALTAALRRAEAP